MEKQKRDTWGSQLGFIVAVAGSAIGLANVWRFPYLVGNYGGAAFILVYLMCLAMIGFPVLMAEIIIGRATQANPAQAFAKLGRNRGWRAAGMMTVVTGFIVSGFYSVVAGWILGYLYEALQGNLTSFESAEHSQAYFESLIASPTWGLFCHFIFIALSSAVLIAGVRGGIERWNKFLLPILFAVLIGLVIRGLTMQGSSQGLYFLLTPDWSALTPAAFLVALGQSFFTLSLGQGTMVTYGSYLKDKENLLTTTFPVVAMDTVVSLLSAVAIFTIVFSVGIEPGSGPGLIFQTLPLVFSQITGGTLLAILFFILVALAALTSEISAMEPTIAYLMDERGWSRRSAVIACGIAVFLLGVPCALSYSLLSHIELFQMNLLDFFSFVASSIMIPLGGLFAVWLVGWRWKRAAALEELHAGAESTFAKHRWLTYYFDLCFRYLAPALILLVFLNALGVIG